MPSRVVLPRAVSSRAVLVFLAVALAVVAGACEMATEVRITVKPDGSGEVAVRAEFDAEATERLGDPEATLALDDLAAGGWTVVGPQDRDGGGIAVEATKRFGSPDALDGVLAEVAGGSPTIFSDVELTLSSGFASSEWDLSGRITLTGSLDQFGDDDLTATLDGLPLGRTPDELAAELGDARFPLDVVVEPPVPVASAEDTDGEAAVFPADSVRWRYEVPGEPVDEVFTARATERDPAPFRWMALAVLALVVAAVIWVGARMVVHRRAGPRADPQTGAPEDHPSVS